jgi:hypothetical protein
LSKLAKRVEVNVRNLVTMLVKSMSYHCTVRCLHNNKTKFLNLHQAKIGRVSLDAKL